MKYLFTLLLTGFISFNVLANPETPPDDETPKPSQETYLQKSSVETETNTVNLLKSQPDDQQPSTEAETQKTDSTPPEQLILLTTQEMLEKPLSNKKKSPQLESITNLQDTKIGRAIIAGDIEAYEDALNELKSFDIPLTDILQKTTSDKKDLIDLLIEANMDFFTNEMFNLFVAKILTLHSQNTPRVLSTTSIAETQTLLEKARQVNNERAVLMLTNLQNLFIQYDRELIAIKEIYNKELIKLKEEHGKELAETIQRENETVKALYEEKNRELTEQHQETAIAMGKQIIELIKKHKNRFYLDTGVFLSGGVLSVWGYQLFSSPAVNVVSPQITEFFSIVSDKEIGAVSMALGAGLAVKGLSKVLYKCYNSVKQRKQIKKHQRQLDNLIKTRQKPPEKQGGSKNAVDIEFS